MVFIPSGTFSMGGDPGLMGGGSQSHNSSYPIHEVTLDAFWMDEAEVTNQQFADFVEATGYVTFAERPLPEAFINEVKRISNERIRQMKLVLSRSSGSEREAIEEEIANIEKSLEFGDSAGSIVFTPPEDQISSRYDYTQWWQILPGATWRSPEGPGSTWIGREDHPVVNVNSEDAATYAKWAGKRLPTEAEWERAARGGLSRKPYTWGKDFAPLGEGTWMANIWQGVWPYENTGEDGFVLTAPVKAFPPNAFGLYDISGNVWEIVADRYHPQTYAHRAEEVSINPTGPSAALISGRAIDPERFVIRGGSFLCSDSWCRGYQPGSRQAQESDSPANHTGFRCARDYEATEISLSSTSQTPSLRIDE
ncbi:MAG: formylglycine-generating enzyme family protein [Verrucomicrobiota bacterium]